MFRMMMDNWWAMALRGLFAVLFGITALVWPAITVATVIVLFGVFALLEGIFGIVALLFGGGKREWGVQLVEGIVSIAAGLIALLWPGITVAAFVFLIAAWAVLSGVFQVVMAIRLRQEITNEWLLGLGGVLSVLLGVLFFARPAVGVLSSVWVLGLYAILFGVALLVLGFRLRGLRKRLDDRRERLGTGPTASSMP